MAEVVDIIHKLTYEADYDVVSEVNKEFGVQLKQLQELKAREADLQRQLNSTSQTEISNRRKIEGLLNQTKKQYEDITVAIGKTTAANTKLATSLVQSGKNLGALSNAGSQLLREAPAFTYSIQTGILALSNNIPILLDQLNAAQRAGASTRQVFAALGSSIFGLTGLLTIGVSVLTIFGDKIFDVKTEAEKAADAIERISKETERLRKEVKSFSEATFAETVDENIEKSIEGDKRRVESLKARGASEEAILEAENNVRRRQIKQINDEIKLYETRTSSIIRFDKEIVELKQKRANLENEIETGALNLERKRQDEREKQLDKAREQYQRLQDAIRDVSNEIKHIEYSEFEATARDLEAAANTYAKIVKILESATNGQTGVVQPENYPSGRFNSVELEAGAAQGRINAKAYEAEQAKNKRIKEQSEQAIDDYSNYAMQTTASTLQSIYDMQLYYLDKEIQARQERVDQAVLLAEKGNTEILESERNGLIEAQNEREKIATRQLQINALLQASSAAIAATQAIQVVTNAGATGDPYTTAARIAAAVAALAAGFAFVTNLTQAFKFKDGVIDLNGPGNETSDSIHARLSRGESVMTAKETKEYKPYLKAMRNGSFDKMLVTHAGVNATGKNDYKSLEKRLDKVVDAVENIHISAKQSMDRHGLTQVLESHRKQEADRWR